MDKHKTRLCPQCRGRRRVRTVEVEQAAPLPPTTTRSAAQAIETSAPDRIATIETRFIFIEEANEKSRSDLETADFESIFRFREIVEECIHLGTWPFK